MDSDFSSRVPSSRSQADAVSPECLYPRPLNLCDVVLHDRYRILKPLAEGGSGKTFLARDEQRSAKSFCVIKQLVLHSQTNHHPRSTELFQQESQRLAALVYPQLPQLLDAFEQDGQSFIVQEWMDGWTLEQEVADGVPFNEVEIWQLLLELLPVLQFLHDRQVIHRDIKPANIIRRRSSGGFQSKTHPLVLVDFATAQQVDDGRITTETMLGSAEYAAPEQIRGQAVFASDLYSLGLTCLYLLTQTAPFDLYDMGDATWKWQAYLTQPISPPLKQILCTLLQPAVRRRYQSAAEVLAAIDAFCVQVHLPSKQIASTIAPAQLAPIASAKTEHPCTTTQCAAQADLSPAAIAAINAVRTTRSLSATIYNPHTQRWYDVPPQTEPTDVASKVAVISGARLDDGAAAPRGWEHRSPLVSKPAPSRQTSMGWRLFAVGMGTAVASVAMTCLWLCVSIIFLALAMPPHSSATSSNADSQKPYDQFHP